MSVQTDKVIITAEVAGRKIDVEAFEVIMDERMDEGIYQGMQKCAQKLQKEMLEIADERLRQTKAREWENKGRKDRQIVTSNGFIKYKRRVYKDGRGNCPKRVDFQGVTNLVKAAQITGVKRFILISSIAVIHPEHPLNRFGRILEWKFKSEEVLRKSGLEYASVRPGGLTDAPGGSQTLLLSQGDHIRGTLSREDLAELCLQALSYPSPSRVTFEAIAEEKTGSRNCPALFSALYPD